MQTIRRVGPAVAVLLALAAVSGRAAITQTINYQGFLTDKATGLPIDGTRDMQFRLCDTAAGSCASALFSESRCASGGNGPAVGVTKGRYEVEVGSSTAGGIPATVFTSNSAVWLEVLVDTNGDCTGFEALSPRLRMQGAPYAFSALQASTATTLAANPSNCSAGNYPLGVDAAGNVESCTAVSSIPSGAVMFFNLASCPTGWTEYTSARGRYVVGLPLSGTLNGTSGTALTNLESRAAGVHSHTTSDSGHAHGITDPGHFHSINNSPTTTFQRYRTSGGGQGTAGGTDSDIVTPTMDTKTTGVTVNSNTTGVTVNNSAGVSGTNAPFIQLLVCQKS